MPLPSRRPKASAGPSAARGAVSVASQVSPSPAASATGSTARRRPRVVGRRLTQDGWGQHHQAPEEKQEERVPVGVRLRANFADQPRRPKHNADIERNGDEPIQERPARHAVGPVGVADKAEHTGNTHGVVHEQQPRRRLSTYPRRKDRHLRGMAGEEFGMAPNSSPSGRKTRKATAP